MNSLRKVQLMALVLGLSLGMALVADTAPRETVIISGDWHPYTFPTAKTEVEKHVEDLLHLQGHTLEWRYSGFDLALEHLRREQADVAFPYYSNEDREQEFLFSDPVLRVENIVLYNRRNPLFQAWREEDNEPAPASSTMQDAVFGLVRGYSYAGLFDGAPPEHSLWFPSELRALAALLSGEIDLLPIEQRVWQSLQLRNFPDRYHLVRRIEGLSWRETIHMLAARNEAGRRIIDDFNKVLSEFPLAPEELELSHDILAMAEEIDRGTVLLRKNQLQPMILGHTERHSNSENTLVIPEGTTALVLDWAPEYFEYNENVSVVQLMKARTQVLLLNGPHAGKTVYIENAHIEMN